MEFKKYKSLKIGTGNILLRDDFKKATSPANEVGIIEIERVDKTKKKKNLINFLSLKLFLILFLSVSRTLKQIN
jgi:hypothetical protein